MVYMKYGRHTRSLTHVIKYVILCPLCTPVPPPTRVCVPTAYPVTNPPALTGRNNSKGPLLCTGESPELLSLTYFVEFVTFNRLRRSFWIRRRRISSGFIRGPKPLNYILPPPLSLHPPCQGACKPDKIIKIIFSPPATDFVGRRKFLRTPRWTGINGVLSKIFSYRQQGRCPRQIIPPNSLIGGGRRRRWHFPRHSIHPVKYT